MTNPDDPDIIGGLFDRLEGIDALRDDDDEDHPRRDRALSTSLSISAAWDSGGASRHTAAGRITGTNPPSRPRRIGRSTNGISPEHGRKAKPPLERTVTEINAMSDDFPGLKRRLLRAALETENATR